MEILWNDLSEARKTLLAIIKRLSYTYGAFIPVEDIREKYATLNYKNGVKSLGADTGSLNKTGLTRSVSNQQLEGQNVRCVEVTTEGMIFIFKNQSNIESWASYKNI